MASNLISNECYIRTYTYLHILSLVCVSHLAIDKEQQISRFFLYQF